MAQLAACSQPECVPFCLCDAGIPGNCGYWVVPIYFVLFVLLTMFILLNLFIAIIIENFEKNVDMEQWRLQPTALEDLVDVCGKLYDGTGKHCDSKKCNGKCNMLVYSTLCQRRAAIS